MAGFNDEQLKKMQEDAMRRVFELQRRAKLSYDRAQQPPGEPDDRPQPQADFTPSPQLPRALGELVNDPILRAALAYLL